MANPQQVLKFSIKCMFFYKKSCPLPFFFFLRLLYPKQIFVQSIQKDVMAAKKGLIFN